MTAPPSSPAPLPREGLDAFDALMSKYLDSYRGAIEAEAEAGIDAPGDPDVDRCFERAHNRRNDVDAFVARLVAAVRAGAERATATNQGKTENGQPQVPPLSRDATWYRLARSCIEAYAQHGAGCQYLRDPHIAPCTCGLHDCVRELAATDVLAGVSVPAVDPSWSTPETPLSVPQPETTTDA